LSDPRITLRTSGLSSKATELANRLSRDIGTLSDEDLSRLLDVLNAARDRNRT